MMHSINSFIENKLYELTNNVPEGTHTYYNKVTQCFEEYDSFEGDNDNNLVIAPCSYYLKSEARRIFFDSLNEEQKEKARSYPFRRGYMDYLREIGLYDYLVEAEYTAVINEWRRWIKKNSFDISKGVKFA